MLVKNRTILEDQFIDAFNELLNIKMPAKQCVEVSTCMDELSAQFTILMRARKAIADKYCLKDSDDKPILDEKDNLTFETDDLKKACFEELREIYEEETEISLTNKIKIGADVPMTPVKFSLLRDLIEVV